MEVLPSNDNVVIDEWLNRLERFTLHRFNEEEAEMRRLGYPHLDEHQKDHSMALSKLRVTRRMWDNDQNTVHLWHYLDKDYFNWFTQHLNNFDIPADNFSRRNHKPKTLAQPKSNSSLDIS